MSRTKLNTKKDFKPAPNLDLRGKIGTKVLGIFRGRLESKGYPGKFSTMLDVLDTDGDTTLYNKETEEAVSVDIVAGDRVFLKEGTVLAIEMAKLKEGDKVEIVYVGKGDAKPGRKAPFLYDVFLIEDK